MDLNTMINLGGSPQGNIVTPQQVVSESALSIFYKQFGLHAGFHTEVSSVTLNGSDVSQWGDFSGNNNHLIQGTASDQPGYDDTTFTFPQLTLDNATEYLQTGTYGTTVTTPATYFFVGVLNLTGIMIDGLPAGRHILQLITGSKYRLSAGTILDSVAQTDMSSPHILAIQFDGATSNLYRDGGTVTLTGDSGTNSSTGLSIGASSTGTVEAGSSVYSVLVYNSLLTDTNLNDIGNQLATDFSLTWVDI